MTAAVYDALSSASVDLLAKVNEDSRLASTYWALRDTAEEAVSRGACMVIGMTG